MGSTSSTLVHLVQREKKTRALLLQYADAKGEVQDTFKSMKVSRDMRLSWLQRWQAMDEDSSNLLDYQEFLQGCGLTDNLWSWRMFNLLDKNFTGSVDFYTFFTSLPRLLVFDRANAIEVAFRLCSRRGATCEPANAVLDEKDIRGFVEERYPTLNRRHALHRAVEVLRYLDEDCSGGISFEEFEKFCHINPVFLTAVYDTVGSMREVFFGQQFWKDFSQTARTFDEATQREIFCSQMDISRPNTDTITGGLNAGGTRRDAVATDRTFVTMVDAVSTHKKRKIDEMSSMARVAAGKLRRIASESNLRRHLPSVDRKSLSAKGAGRFMMEHAKLWSTTALRGAKDGTRGLRSRVGEAGSSLRRVVSDTDLVKRTVSSSSKEKMKNANPWAKALNAKEVGQRLHIAKGSTVERLAASSRQILHAKSVVRENSMQPMNNTRGERLKLFPDPFTVRKGAAGDMARAGRLKAAATVAFAIRRVHVLAESARKGRETITTTLNIGSLDGTATSLPRRLPDDETRHNAGRRMVGSTKSGGGRALEALKRAARQTAIVRCTMHGPARHQRQAAQVTARESAFPSMAPSEQDKASLDGRSNDDVVDEELGDGIDVLSETGNAWDPFVSFKPKAGKTLSMKRHWAMTEQFYAHLTIAAERLEAKRTTEKGYDFSADFPKLWGTTHMHGSQDTKEYLERRKGLSGSRRTAKLYMRFISIWQDAGTGRTKLAQAFDRWRLQTCDAAMEDTGLSSLSTGGGSDQTWDSMTGRGATRPRENARRTVTDLWDAAGFADQEQDMHALIMAKAHADRPLPSELCEVYRRELVERINRRQTETNVPILPMPFC